MKAPSPGGSGDKIKAPKADPIEVKELDKLHAGDIVEFGALKNATKVSRYIEVPNKEVHGNEHMFEEPHGKMFYAERGGERIGFLGLTIDRQKNEAQIRVLRLGEKSDPETLQALLADAVDYLRSKTIHSVTLKFDAENHEILRENKHVLESEPFNFEEEGHTEDGRREILRAIL